MNPIDSDLTLAELVTEQPHLAPHLDALGLDFCCGGQRRIIDAVDAITSTAKGPMFSTMFLWARSARLVQSGSFSGVSRLPNAHATPPGVIKRPASGTLVHKVMNRPVYTSIQRSVVMAAYLRARG